MVARSFKRWLVGNPLKMAHLAHERLTNPVALAVFASDALSSTAYATEEILVIITLAGTQALGYALPIAGVIVFLIAVVAVSYRQTVNAYPTGGGAYIVAKDNLGMSTAAVAGAALLIDYILTVAVSVAAGVAAIVSAVPAVADYRVALCVAVVLFVALANLRGVRESGALFALPTYGFILTMFVMLAVGFYRVVSGEVVPATYPPDHLHQAHEGAALMPLTALLLLRGFSSGCAALTGIEAISNGVTAFKAPEGRNAATVLAWMAIILAVIFLGITYLATQYQLLPYSAHQEGYQTLVSQVAEQSFGGRNFGYYLVQGFTSLILLLAANTAFADFPRLASLISRDGYLPRQFGTLGDKLVFANGIIILAILSSLLLMLFQGDTHSLIPLYAVGVFLSFTISQSGMVIHWVKLGAGKHWYAIAINALGGCMTGVVLLVIAYTKFTHGAWIVVVLIPLLIWMFLSIKRHYRLTASSLSLEGKRVPAFDHLTVRHTVIVPISGIQAAVVQALQYAVSLGPDNDVRAIYVNLDHATTERLQERWARWGMGIPLVILDSKYRSILEPLLQYIEYVQAEHEAEFITVLLPEFVTTHWWQALLHNQTATMIRSHLAFRPGVVVTSVRHHITAPEYDYDLPKR